MPSSRERNVGPLSSRWSVHGWQQCADADARQDFSGLDAAALWLMQFRADPAALSMFRSLLADHSHLRSPSAQTDQQLLRHVASLLARGLVHAHRVKAPATGWRAAQAVVASAGKSESKRDSPRPVTQTRAPVAKPAEEPDTFSVRTNAAATAAVLRSAAQNGTPFCEECAKAAARQAA